MFFVLSPKWGAKIFFSPITPKPHPNSKHTPHQQPLFISSPVFDSFTTFLTIQICFLQTSDLDTFLCKQEWERRLEEELEKPPRRDSASQLDDFFEPPHNRHQPTTMSYVSMRTLPGTDDDVFLRPPLWEDIASSIQNIDPENANMLGVSPAGHVKLEAVDDLASCAPTPSPLLSPLEIKTEKVSHTKNIGVLSDLKW